MVYGQLLSPAQLGVRNGGDTPRIVVDKIHAWDGSTGEDAIGWIVWHEEGQAFVAIYPDGSEWPMTLQERH